MFRNTVLCLTLHVLASLTESQILQNYPWSYPNCEQVPRIDVAKQNTGIHQPLSIQTQLQLAPLGSRYANLNENQLLLDKLETNPNIQNTYDNNPSNYVNSIPKCNPVVNPPNVVNNYYIVQPDPFKRTDYNHHFNNNREYTRNINSGGATKNRRHKEKSIKNYNEKPKKHRKYRQSEDHTKISKLVEDFTSDDIFHDTNMKTDIDALTEIKETKESLMNNEDERRTEATECVGPRKNESFQNLTEKEKQLGFYKSQSTKENYNLDNKRRNKENRKTRNLKTVPSVEYQTKYLKPQEEFNKYMQNIMAANITNPFYFPNDMYPYILDSFYKAADSTKSKKRNSTKRKNTRKSNKNNNIKNKEDIDKVIELSPTLQEPTPLTITTGAGQKKDIYLNLKIKKKDSPPDNDINLNTLHTNDEDNFILDSEEESTYKPFSINLFHPVEDDDVEYYPDFTLFNHAYLTSSEEEELNQLQRNHDNFRNDWDYYAEKVKSYVEHSNKKQSQTKQDVSFKPDFITVSNKNVKAFTGDVNMSVETIYAPSRVVSYSQTEKRIQNDKEEEENFWFREGDTTIVLSRSIN